MTLSSIGFSSLIAELSFVPKYHPVAIFSILYIGSSIHIIFFSKYPDNDHLSNLVLESTLPPAESKMNSSLEFS